MNCRTNAAARPNTQLDSIFLHYERALCITGAFSIRVGVSTKVTQNCNDTKEKHMKQSECMKRMRTTSRLLSRERATSEQGLSLLWAPENSLQLSLTHNPTG
ncbi:uncharacterized protein LOC143742373 isoform X1 [Siphateles boraxobius]|uniref:uncharacterized protein LOC143742373 isoform X1 n=1 Tax=Siphateles boraxobius TaxID=180520 RepID=UPI0040630407